MTSQATSWEEQMREFFLQTQRDALRELDGWDRFIAETAELGMSEDDTIAFVVRWLRGQVADE